MLEMMHRLIVLGSIAAALSTGQSQAKSPGNSAPLPRLARIEGVIMDDRYLRPLKRGYVVMKPTNAGHPFSAETDDAGKFSIENIDPGEYSIEARRDNYISASWARRGGIRMPRVFTIGQGQEWRDLTFRLEPWGALEGKIRFDDGEPAFNVPVILYRKQYHRGKLLYQPSGSTRTNDRGDYRIPGLQPGSYIIAAIYNKPVKLKNAEGETETIPDKEWSYATTYYTSGQSFTDAIPVKLESGRELSGLDIFLGLVRAVRVKIRVTDSCTGELSSKASLQLYRMDELGNPVVPVNAEITGRGGEFTLRGLGPGQYMVTSSSDPPPNCNGTLRDRRILSVADYPQDGIELILMPPVLARFSLGAEGGPGNDFGMFNFHLEPRSGLPVGTMTLDRSRGGFYQFTALLDSQEEYDLIVDRKAPDAYLKAPLVVKGTNRITIGMKGAALTGSVINDKREAISGATVTLIPDPAKDRFQHYTEAYSNELGLFGMRGITPGKYLAVPWLDVPPCDLFNWDNLDACKAFGTTVDFNESDSKGLELVLKPNN